MTLAAGGLSGCATWMGGAAGIPVTRPPVVLRLDGAVLAEPGARAAAVRAVAQVTQRRVEVVGDAAADAPLLKALASRERAAVGGYDWREPRCAARADTLVAARLGAEGVYRLSLAPAAPAVPPPSRGLLDVFRAAGAPVRGTVTVDVFDGSRRRRAGVEGPDVESAVASGVARLPGLPPARWAAVATGLVRAGCPFLALAVQDLRLRDDPAGRAVRRRALAAMARAVERRVAASRPAEPAPTGDAATPTAAPDARYSCEALCQLHMVEVCNKDRTLWNQHLATWERTGCGTRRPEPFLVECYRRQQISGAFHDACVVPCEASPAGRNALLDVLQGAGCLRSGPS